MFWCDFLILGKMKWEIHVKIVAMEVDFGEYGKTTMTELDFRKIADYVERGYILPHILGMELAMSI